MSVEKNKCYFPIREASALTGVNPVTIRAWERRYGLIKPYRTSKGHRLYSQKDVEHIKTVVRYINQGVSVGKVKQILNNQSQSESYENFSSNSNISTSNTHFEKDLISKLKNVFMRIKKAILEQDMGACSNALIPLLTLYPSEIFADQIYPELMKYLNNSLWNERITSRLERNMFLSLLRLKLKSETLKSFSRNTQGRILICGYQTGELNHPIIQGLLLANILKSNGYKVLFHSDVISPKEVKNFMETHQIERVIIFMEPDSYAIEQFYEILEHAKKAFLLLHEDTQLNLDQNISRCVLQPKFQGVYDRLIDLI